MTKLSNPSIEAVPIGQAKAENAQRRPKPTSKTDLLKVNGRSCGGKPPQLQLAATIIQPPHHNLFVYLFILGYVNI